VFIAKVCQLTDEDVNEDAEVVGIEVFCHPLGGKKDVQQLQDEELHAEIFRSML